MLCSCREVGGGEARVLPRALVVWCGNAHQRRVVGVCKWVRRCEFVAGRWGGMDESGQLQSGQVERGVGGPVTCHDTM